MAHRYFEGATHAAVYVKYRPSWPKETMDVIMKYLTEKMPPPLMQAVDVGCGSGQFTKLICDHFDHVTGVDISENQIKHANETETSEKIVYKVGSGETIPVENNSAELLTVAQAVHWFDLDKFYAEADRILKPNGVLALLGYGLPKLYSHPEVNEMNRILTEFDQKCVWSERNAHVVNLYKDLPIPDRYPDKQRDDSLEIQRDMTLTSFCGYLSSWSGYQQYMEKTPGDNILETLKKEMYIAMKTDLSPDEATVDVRYPVFILMARKANAN